LAKRCARVIRMSDGRVADDTTADNTIVGLRLEMAAS
jgi:hypothetical protein